MTLKKIPIIARQLATILKQRIWSNFGELNNQVNDVFFEWRNDLDTEQPDALSHLTIDSVNRAAGYNYTGSPVRALSKTLARLPGTRGGVFMDVGCGKGKAVLIASRFGFSRTIGLEFAKELHEISKINLYRWKQRINRKCDIELFHLDCLDYCFKNDETFFYFFSPFNSHILNAFLDRIKTSISVNPRSICLLFAYYKGFTHKADIETHPLTMSVPCKRYKYGFYEVYIYTIDQLKLSS